MGGARNGCASFGRPVTRGCRVACLARGPSQNWGLQPSACTAPWGAAHWRAERCFSRGACPRKKRILVGSAGCGRRKSATLALPGESVGSEGPADACGCALPGESVGAERPADVYGVCPTGRVRWGGKAGGCLWGVPCRASPLGRKGRRIPMGGALPGQSVGSERPADAYGVCPSGRVRWSGKAGRCLRSVPCRASLLGRKGRRIPMGCALPGESVGLERPAEICDAFWVRCGNGFPAAGPCFRFGKNFFEVAAHLAGLIRYTG